ncbi:hypothetical protein MHB50_04695 [Siminovitchia sp. FSL H7-0308]|uniref:Uncharacterized protein n=1 Tax=Siminovitchia thermophila TaxID=1245522 RepID=A0ABS2R5E0_9BACI|nr:hypothetical protein [Siminovitchia thermophila]MBM7714803.1 hypothetical protein [Siminovitchia thermophila]ONK24435.1 hypothetical protein BLX87_04640 [Bacillus sp. VT-16-64]
MNVAVKESFFYEEKPPVQKSDGHLYPALSRSNTLNPKVSRKRLSASKIGSFRPTGQEKSGDTSQEEISFFFMGLAQHTGCASASGTASQQRRKFF